MRDEGNGQPFVWELDDVNLWGLKDWTLVMTTLVPSVECGML